MEFKKKYGHWAVITGGTSGIGEALAEIVAQRGINIVLVARNENVLLSKASRMKELYNVEVRTIKADLSVAGNTKMVIDQTNDINVGLFIPCAGIENHGFLPDISTEKELALIQLNITSTYVLTQHFSRKMVLNGKGGILFVSSTIAHMPNPYFSNYAGSKSYILNFGLSLNWEMKQKGVDVTVLSPGPTKTPMSDVLDKDMDMSKIPFPIMSAKDVAMEGINALGKKPSIIAGGKNRFMIGLGRRFMSTSTTISMGGKMMEKLFKSK